jgi:hypothetical protein
LTGADHPPQRGPACYITGHVDIPTTAIAEFNPAERDYVRRELDLYFTTLPTVAAGFQLRIWKSGPRKGTPKLPQAAKGLLDRGLLRLDETARLPCLFFTPEGLAALRCMMADPRLANPQKIAHIRRELGLDRDYGAEAAE